MARTVRPPSRANQSKEQAPSIDCKTLFYGADRCCSHYISLLLANSFNTFNRWKVEVNISNYKTLANGLVQKYYMG